MNTALIQQVFDLIKLNNPLIAVESPLQERLRRLKSFARECQQKNVNCYLWAMSDDALHQLVVNEQDLVLQPVTKYQAIAKSRREHYFEVLRFWKTSDLQGILILEGIFPWLGTNTSDPDFFLTAEWIKSALVNLKLYNRNSNKTAILLGPNASLSSDIAAEVPTITQQLPTVEEITAYLPGILPNSYSDREIHEIALAAVGMYLADIDYGIRWAITSENTNAQELTKKLSTYKIDLLRRVYNIHFLQPPAIEVGGLDLMQSAFKKYKRLLTPLAKAYNLRLPKGILLIGPPGTGKSYSAKACSQQLGIPMIILEWGSFRSYGNLAEYKLKNLLALVDRINRVILYLDDFDKGFAGDDDLSRRLAGMLFKLGNEYKDVPFWMSQVKIPLDIIFLKDNVVTTVIHDAPPCAKNPCPIYKGRIATQVLELPPGAARIQVGERLKIEPLSALRKNDIGDDSEISLAKKLVSGLRLSL